MTPLLQGYLILDSIHDFKLEKNCIIMMVYNIIDSKTRNITLMAVQTVFGHEIMPIYNSLNE